MDSKEDVKLMSLDDYIKKREIDKQFELYSFRKSNFVNLSLNEFVKAESKKNLKNKVDNGRFDRPSLRDNSGNETDSDEEKDSKRPFTEDDIEMKDVESIDSNKHIISYENQLESENCDRKDRFTTVEQLNNIKVSSQAWRLENQNVIVNRPKNMPHLTTLGSKNRQDNNTNRPDNNNNRIQSGKVNKPYNNHYNNFISNLKTVKTGKFVEKGSFTYKHDNFGLVGIDRQKSTEQQNYQNTTAAPQINIHLDLNSVFNEMKNVQPVTTEIPVRINQHHKNETPQQLNRVSSISSKSGAAQDFSKLKFAAADLLEFLKARRAKRNNNLI
ncbi:unnamed protein product [Diamesa serratosioi]